MAPSGGYSHHALPPKRLVVLILILMLQVPRIALKSTSTSLKLHVRQKIYHNKIDILLNSSNEANTTDR